MTPSEARRPHLVVVNAVGSDSGGGRTWTLSVIRELRRSGLRGLRWHFLVAQDVASMLGAPAEGLQIMPVVRKSTVRRMIWEQTVVPWRYGRREGDVLVSAANFGPLIRTRRTVLLARNALHFAEFRASGRRQRRIKVETFLARASVRRSTLTITATDAMATAVAAYTGREPLVVHFGPGLAVAREGRRVDGGRYCFVHRTFWGPHKRLADLLRAVRELAGTHRGRFVVRSACDPRTPFASSYVESETERRLLEDPRVAEHVEFAAFDPRDGATVEGNAAIIPSTVESFCFPLAEAVALGMPVVVADSAFARELCGPGAIYTQPGHPGDLAEGMRALVDGGGPDPAPRELRERLSWERHVNVLAAACRHVAQHDQAPELAQLLSSASGEP